MQKFLNIKNNLKSKFSLENFLKRANVLRFSNFKANLKYIRKKELGKIFLIWIGTSLFLSSQNQLVFPVFLFLTYYYICQHHKPDFRFKLSYTESKSFSEYFKASSDNEKQIKQKLNLYLKKYSDSKKVSE